MQIVIRTPTKREENDLYQKQLAETKERKAKQESKLKRKMQKGRGRKEAQASSRASSNARGRSTSAGPNKKGKREDGPSGQQKQQKQQKQDSGRKKGTRGKRFGTDSTEKVYATAAKKHADGTEEVPIELDEDPVEGEAEGGWKIAKGKGRGKQNKTSNLNGGAEASAAKPPNKELNPPDSDDGDAAGDDDGKDGGEAAPKGRPTMNPFGNEATLGVFRVKVDADGNKTAPAEAVNFPGMKREMWNDVINELEAIRGSDNIKLIDAGKTNLAYNLAKTSIFCSFLSKYVHFPPH